jgi:hypothetical protein
MLEVVLDELLGIGARESAVESLVDVGSDALDTMGEPEVGDADSADVVIEPQHTITPSPVANLAQEAVETEPIEAEAAGVTSSEVTTAQTVTSVDVVPAVANGAAERIESPSPTIADFAGGQRSSVRRRTPPGVFSRYATAQIPRATGPDGRLLPRAYVAKRRTPVASAAVADTARQPAPTSGSSTSTGASAASSPEVVTPIGMQGAVVAAVEEDRQKMPASPLGNATLSADAIVLKTPTARSPRASAPDIPLVSTPNGDLASGARHRPTPDRPPANARGNAGASANQGALVGLLVVALLALGAFVLFALRR